MKIISHALTDIGLKRKINQDAYLKDDSLRLYVVADGMGGHRGGEVASGLAVEVMQRFARENRQLGAREILDRGINMSCQEIFKTAKENPDLAGMGTTVIALLFHEDYVYVGQVGDSRAYLLHGGHTWQITEDHSLLNEEIRSGRLDAGQVANYQFKNVITRSVGYENHVTVDVYRRRVRAGDTLVICTDGLSGLVDIREVGEHVHQLGLEAGLKRLVALANARGGDDNITVLACSVRQD